MAKSRMAQEQRKKIPSFFKILIGDYFAHLRIPPAFAEQMKIDYQQRFTLESRDMRVWHVNVVKVGNHLYFQQGWSEFVRDNDLKEGEFLVFCYEGDSKFKIQMYGRSACEKVGGLDSRKKHRPLSCHENQNEEEAMSGDQQEGINKNETESEPPVVLSNEGRDSNAVRTGRVSLNSPRQGMREEGFMNSTGFVNPEDRVVDPKKEIETVDLDDSDDDSSERYLPDQRSSWTPNRTASKRKNYACESANKSNSRFPGFQASLKRSYLRGGYLNIPMAFLKKTYYLEAWKTKIVVLVTSNRSWEVLMVCSDFARFTSGWTAFTKDNCLQEGDLCEFKLIKTGDVVFRVSITRRNNLPSVIGL